MSLPCPGSTATDADRNRATWRSELQDPADRLTGPPCPSALFHAVTGG
ncbi:hypothetical protein [Corynebacterium halotolerans]|nr:hypothetical protein [Corynebacterium halotolerans]